MRTQSNNKKQDFSFGQNVRHTEIGELMQAAVIGLLLGEFWHFGQRVGVALNRHLEQWNFSEAATITVCAIVFGIGAAYLYTRRASRPVTGILNAGRIDLILLAVIGFGAVASTNGFLTQLYQRFLETLSTGQLILFPLLSISVALAYVLKAALPTRRAAESQPIFLSDTAVKDSEEDLLDQKEKAAQFAELVLNGDSKESLVFGLDAPWGVGKSSFINFCWEYWRQRTTGKIIVYRFEPLRYDDNGELTIRFVEDLVNTIEKHSFSPTIRPLFSKYSRLIRGTSDFSLFGLRFEPSQTTIEDTLENLSQVLRNLDSRVIIVVDDLDRLSWSTIKNILFAVKRSFMLPNISYVLCYDTEKLSLSQNQYEDADKVREFLEKFINVKFNLFVSSKSLADYVTHNLDHALNRNLDIALNKKIELKAIINKIKEIFESNDFHLYQDLLGDVRKIKRLINTLILCKIEGNDSENRDFETTDLIHLLLIYINYPEVFRLIYSTETNGKGGFFSLVRNYVSSPIRMENSKQYKDYLERPSASGIKFLLGRLFSVDSRLGRASLGEIKESDRRLLACFNDKPYRNLERYLNLIVNQERQKPRDSYRFYVNKKNEFIKKRSLSIVLQDPSLSFAQGDFALTEFWRIISNSAGEFDKTIGQRAIEQILTDLPQHSFIEAENIGKGSRRSLIYSLLNILNDTNWTAAGPGGRIDRQKNVHFIAEWIFGEGQHQQSGIIDRLAAPKRGACGLMDCMLFRLYCSADRGISLSNLHDALALHATPPGPTHGITTEMAKHGMREISQKIFQIFSETYISPKKNLIDEVDELSLEDVTGQAADFVRAHMDSDDAMKRDIEITLLAERNRIKSFLIYQLGNSFISSGVGCGYYDEDGNGDRRGIASAFNAYLFDVCFNPWMNDRAFEQFVEYLLTQFSDRLDFDADLTYIPDIPAFTKVLNRDRLAMYWLDFGPAIQDMGLPTLDRPVPTHNYTATYARHLPQVYRVLNEFASTWPCYRQTPNAS